MATPIPTITLLPETLVSTVEVETPFRVWGWRSDTTSRAIPETEPPHHSLPSSRYLTLRTVRSTEYFVMSDGCRHLPTLLSTPCLSTDKTGTLGTNPTLMGSWRAEQDIAEHESAATAQSTQKLGTWCCVWERWLLKPPTEEKAKPKTWPTTMGESRTVPIDLSFKYEYSASMSSFTPEVLRRLPWRCRDT